MHFPTPSGNNFQNHIHSLYNRLETRDSQIQHEDNDGRLYCSLCDRLFKDRRKLKEHWRMSHYKAGKQHRRNERGKKGRLKCPV